MTTIYYQTEEAFANNFIQYWKQRGIDVKTYISGDFQQTTLRSDLVMRVPKNRHDNIHGTDAGEIKNKGQRKWR